MEAILLPKYSSKSTANSGPRIHHRRPIGIFLDTFCCIDKGPPLGFLSCSADLSPRQRRIHGGTQACQPRGLTCANGKLCLVPVSIPAVRGFELPDSSRSQRPMCPFGYDAYRPYEKKREEQRKTRGGHVKQTRRDLEVWATCHIFCFMYAIVTVLPLEDLQDNDFHMPLKRLFM